MSNDGGGKARPQRSNTTGKPYERPKSLFSRVTDTVRGILSPSWIFETVTTITKSSTEPSSGSSSEPVLSNQYEESDIAAAPGGFASTPAAAPSRQEDDVQSGLGPRLMERPEVYSQFSAEPPLRTTRRSPPGSGYMDFGADARPPLASYGRQSSKVTRPQLDLDDPDINGEISREPSESSEIALLDDERRLPQKESRRTLRPEVIKKGMKRRAEDDLEKRENSSLWSFLEDSNTSPENSSLLGASSSHADSLFYAGKTTYGGSSATRRYTHGTGSTQVFPVRRQIKPKPLVTARKGGMASSTARRILECLEKGSTPINDAKQIPINNFGPRESPLSFSSGLYHKKRRVGTPQNDVVLPPVHKLTTPRMASLARNRRVLDHEDSSTIGMARSIRNTTIDSSLNITTQNPPTDSVRNDVCKAMGKMKRQKSNTTIDSSLKITTDNDLCKAIEKIERQKSLKRRSKKADEEDDIIEVPDLPTDFVLQAKSLPRFNFSSTPQTVAANTLHSVGANFQFSSPITKSSPDKETPSITRSPGFKFKSPRKVRTDSTSVTPSFSTQFNFAPTDSSTVKRQSQPDTVPAASEEPAASFGQPAKEMNTGSVMDILGGSSSEEPKSTQKPLSLGEQFKPKAGSWECDVCMVQNAPNTEVCVACQTTRTVPSTAPSVNSKPGQAAPTVGFGSQFKPAAGSWECSSCMLTNKASDDVCIACQSANPKTSQSKIQNTGFGSQFKKVSGDWECPTCLVQNKESNDKCAACETSNPEPSKQVNPGFGAQFKQAAGTWECSTCMVQNKAEVTRCIACETPNPKVKTVPSNSNTFSAIPKINENVTFGPQGGLQIGSSGTKGFAFDSNAFKSTDNPSGGFKMDASSNPISGGIKLISKVSVGEEKSLENSGFKFETKSSDTLSEGFKLSNPVDETKSSDLMQAAGFAFSKPGDIKPESVNSKVAAPVLSFGLKSPEEKTENKTTDLESSTVAAELGEREPARTPAGFTFGSQTQAMTGSEVSNVSDTQPKETITPNTGFSLGTPLTMTSPGTAEMKSPEPVKASTVPSSNTPAGGLFSFGAAPSASGTTQTTTSTWSAVSTGFAFASQSNTAPPAYDSSQLQTNSALGGGLFQFGAPTMTSPSTGSQPTMSSAAPSSGGLFQFGATSTATSAGSAAPGFQFGATTSSSTDPAVNFQFGATQSAATAASQPAAFSFGATTTSSTAAPPTGFGTPSRLAEPTKIFATPSKPAAPSNVFGTPIAQPVASGTFGTPSTQGKAPAAFGFNTPAKSTASLFAFGANNATSTSQAPSFGTVSAPFGSSNTTQFGNPSTTSGTFSSAFGSTSTTTAPSTVPAFGGVSTAAASGGFGTGTGFQFGQTGPAAPVASAQSGFSFGAPSTSQPTASGLFQFGTGTEPKPSEQPKPPSTGFSFGQQPDANKQSGFSFGASNPAPAANTGLFQFGSTTETKPADPKPLGYSFGQQQPAATQSGFGFGAPSAAPAAAVPGGFNFNATPSMNFGGTTAVPQFSATANPAAPNMFSAGAAGTQGPQRRIRKAVRKIRK